METNITLLGVSDSGKTNFISEAIRDINSFSPKITILPRISKQASGNDLFCDNQYMLKAYENVQWNFSIYDYEGSLLKSHGDDSDVLKDVLYSSNTWIILIDGVYFGSGEDTDEKIIGKIKRSSARVLLPYISEYAEIHNEKMPELLFVVTKADRIISQFSSERIKNIVLESYEGIFTEESSPMILLSETSNTKSAGLAVLSLFFLRYEKEVSDHIFWLEDRNQRISNEISEFNALIYEIESHKILGRLPGNRQKVDLYNGKIFSLRKEISDNNDSIVQNKNDMGLKHLGTCVQCLIDNNKQLVINGFDKINYQYDKATIRKTDGNGVVKGIFVFNVGVLAMLLKYLITEAGFLSVLGHTIVLGIFMVLAYAIKNTVARVVLICSSILVVVNLFGLPGINGWWFAIGYISWFTLSMLLVIALEKWRKRHSEYIFQDELVNFFYTRAKGK